MDILNSRESEVDVEVGEMIAEVWTYPEEVHSPEVRKNEEDSGLLREASGKNQIGLGRIFQKLGENSHALIDNPSFSKLIKSYARLFEDYHK